MIILNLKKINPQITNLSNINYKNVLNSYKNILNYGYIKCPTCNSTENIKFKRVRNKSKTSYWRKSNSNRRWTRKHYGYYERNVIYEVKGTLHAEVIKVQRLKCKGCNKTHALMPDGIVPYKQFNLKTIIESLINNKYNISENIIKNWYKQLQKIFKPLLKTTFVEKRPYELKDIIELEKDRQEFLRRNKRYFFQIKVISISYAPS